MYRIMTIELLRMYGMRNHDKYEYVLKVSFLLILQAETIIENYLNK